MEDDKKQNESTANGVVGDEDITNLRKKLEEAEKLADEYLNNWKRERADFINYKKDELKRLGELIKFGNEGLILEILDLIDDLETAAKHSESLAGEMAPILKKTNDWLAKYGVERIDVGEKFNPELHEAIIGSQELSAEAALGSPKLSAEAAESSEENGTKIEEIRAGYLMQGKVIRPTRVKITK